MMMERIYSNKWSNGFAFRVWASVITFLTWGISSFSPIWCLCKAELWWGYWVIQGYQLQAGFFFFLIFIFLKDWQEVWHEYTVQSYLNFCLFFFFFFSDKQLLNLPSVGVLRNMLVPGRRRDQEMGFHLRSGRASFLPFKFEVLCLLPRLPSRLWGYPALSEEDDLNVVLLQKSTLTEKEYIIFNKCHSVKSPLAQSWNVKINVS